MIGIYLIANIPSHCDVGLNNVKIVTYEDKSVTVYSTLENNHPEKSIEKVNLQLELYAGKDQVFGHEIYYDGTIWPDDDSGRIKWPIWFYSKPYRGKDLTLAKLAVVSYVFEDGIEFEVKTPRWYTFNPNK